MFINMDDICRLLDVEDSSTSLRNHPVSIYANPSFPLLSCNSSIFLKHPSKQDTESISIARIEERNANRKKINYIKNNFDLTQFLIYKNNNLMMNISDFTNAIFKISKGKI